MPTTRQLAALAGVSQSTVSLALRGDPHVRPETRERILQLAELYHYRRIQPATSTERSNDRSIGCITPYINFGSTLHIIRSMMEVAFAESYNFIVLESQHDPERLLYAIHVLAEHRVKGVLISVIENGPIPEAGLLELRSRGIVPVLFESYVENKTLDEVMLDESQFGELAVQYLFDYGHREIAFVGGIRKGPVSRRAVSFQQALRRRNVSIKHFIDIYQQRYAGCNTALALADLLSVPNPPTAIFTGNDEIAIKLMMDALARGIRIPQDLSVMGSGDYFHAIMLSPRLTTINEQSTEVGRMAMRLLFQRLQQPEPASASPQIVRVSPVLVKRASCGAPRQQRLIKNTR
jgi:LacI family transcriptional regulator